MFLVSTGYALSRAALQTFTEKTLRNSTLCPQVLRNDLSEDWNVPLCLATSNVFAGDGRDSLKRERFLMGPPERHLFRLSSRWYWNRKFYLNKEGLNCCSKYTISFHYIRPRTLYTLYFLEYRLKPYGIEYRHPPPQKRRFSDVIRELEMDRISRYVRSEYVFGRE